MRTLTIPQVKIGKCLDLDRKFAEKELLRWKAQGWQKRKNVYIWREEPAPFRKGRFHFHCSNFILSNRKTQISVFHIKPVYYHTKQGEARPLEEICSWHGNRKIILKRSPFELNIHLGYLSWLMKRQKLFGGYLKWEGMPRFIVLNTISTFYPDPHPESTCCDGRVMEIHGGNVGEPWDNVHDDDGEGSTVNDEGQTLFTAGLVSGSGTDYWRYIVRAFTFFDTSAIPDGDIISAAILSLYGYAGGKVDNLGIAPSICVYGTTSISTTGLIPTDFATCGATPYSAGIGYGYWTENSYNDFVFNALGRAAISKTGLSRFSIREADYDAPDTEPTWSISKDSYLDSRSAEYVGTSNDPKLVVTHEAAPTQKSVSDSGLGAEVVGIKGAIPITESGVGVGSLVIKNLLSVLDSGLGSDAVSKAIVYLKSVSDSGVGSEAIFTKLVRAVQDSGVGSDLVQILLKKLLLQESGAGVDQIFLSKCVDIVDSVIGTDAIIRAIDIIIQESGQGVDRVRVPPFYSDKYTPQGDSYTDKYSKQNTQYQDKFL